ncbi:MAG TPA: type II secretion system F family protein, partial [Armatimonadetes bacterium]|nr:type II secretion system F family protein [Armatimonadota bacterium]
MPKFHYRVLDEAGRESTGELLAEDNAEALAKLQEAGWYVLQVRPVNAGAGRLAQWWRDRFQKVKLKEFVAFCRQFATLVNAGVSALRALEVLQDQTKDRKLAETLEALYTDIASGLSLTEAMSKHPRVFSPLFRSMIRAAEAGGILDEVLARLADYLEDELEMKGKVKSALTYPVVVLFFALVVVMVLVFFILPKFGQIFEDIGAPLPVTTRLLLESSEFLLHHWYLMPLTVIGLMVGLRAYGNHPRGRRHLDWLKLKLPIAGELLQKVAIARFARTFASLAASGFPVLQALDIVADTAGNEIIGDAIRTAQ